MNTKSDKCTSICQSKQKYDMHRAFLYMHWWNASHFPYLRLYLLRCCFDIHEVITVYSFSEWMKMGWVRRVIWNRWLEAVWVLRYAIFICWMKNVFAYLMWMCQHSFWSYVMHSPHTLYWVCYSCRFSLLVKLVLVLWSDSLYILFLMRKQINILPKKNCHIG